MSTNSSGPEIIVSHNVAEKRFETQINGELAVAEYQLEGDRMVFTHTFVPPSLRGRGLAEKLVRPALDLARDERRRVVPACSFVAAYIQRHSEYQSLVD